MYSIYLTISGLLLLFAQTSWGLDFGSLTRRDAASGPGFIHVPVQKTAQEWDGSPGTQRRATSMSSVVGLKNMSLQYTINISIAGQLTTVNLDTGSFELWVDPNCSTAARFNDSDIDGGSDVDPLHSYDYCKSIGRYDPASSPTAKDLQESASLTYADNSTVDINYYTDNLGIGGLEISGQQFGVAEDSKFLTFGVMGMGPNPWYGYNSTNLILDSMASQGLIASRAFSLDLKNSYDAEGSIIFGGLNVKKFQGPLQTLQLESPQMSEGVYGGGNNKTKTTAYGYYVRVQSLTMTKPDQHSSNKYDQGSFSAMLDSGTSHILTPVGIASQICDDAGGFQATQLGTISCVVPCNVKDKSGGLDVNFEGKTIRVGFDDLIMEVDVLGHTFCFLAVADTNVATDPPTYFLGDPFLRAAYAVFDWDNQQVHLAQADDCGSEVVAMGVGSDIVPIVAGCDESAAVPSVRSSIKPVMAVALAGILILA